MRFCAPTNRELGKDNRIPEWEFRNVNVENNFYFESHMAAVLVVVHRHGDGICGIEWDVRVR